MLDTNSQILAVLEKSKECLNFTKEQQKFCE